MCTRVFASPYRSRDYAPLNFALPPTRAHARESCITTHSGLPMTVPCLIWPNLWTPPLGHPSSWRAFRCRGGGSKCPISLRGPSKGHAFAIIPDTEQGYRSAREQIELGDILGDGSQAAALKLLNCINKNEFGGGDEGIRTLERLHVTPLAGERLRPLGHVSTDAYSQVNMGDTRRKFPFLKFSAWEENP